eukprot:c25145_g5_i1 orf=139-1329(-)
MHITNCQEVDTFFSIISSSSSSSSRAPCTTLGLSLNNSASVQQPPCQEGPPPHTMQRTTHQGFSPGPLMSFLAPSSMLPAHQYNKLDEFVYARPSPPPVPLELLPLKPSAHKPSLSSPPPPPPSSSSFIWPPQPIAPSAPGIASHFMRGIDMNQLPLTVGRDEIGADMSSLTVGGRTSESSFLVVKRERERSSDAEMERTCEVSSRGSDEEGDGGGSARKKLRLSKEQSTLLEESFKEHSTLNPKQKAELAKQLNLRPRQVEVWFQNRRARTKLKQTEVDCELLKRCCESLTEENRRLQKEVQELRAIKVAPPCVISHDLFMPLPATTLTICPSCERLASHGPVPTPSSTSLSSQLSFARSPPRPLPLRPQLHPHHPLSFPQPPPPQQHVLPSAAC